MATKWNELLQSKPHELVITGKAGSKQVEDENGLNDILFRISSLNFLEVSTSGLLQLPPKIEKLSNLTNLVLHGNNLQELPQEIGKLKKLKLLDVSRNQLKSLPDSLSGLSELQSLLVSSNQLTDLPPISSACLLVIKFDHNEFKEFPAALLNEDNPKINLTEIHGQKNEIASIPPTINRLTALKLMDLRDNALTVIPGELGDCTKLKELQLNGNKLADRRFLKLVEQNKYKQVMDYIRAHFPRGSKNTSDNDGNKVSNESSNRRNLVKDARRRRRSTSRSSRENSECLMDTIKILPVKEDDWFTVTATVPALEQRKIVACIVRNVDLTNEGILKKFLQLQSSLHDGICNKRQIATIAVHDLSKISSKSVTFDVKPPGKLKLIPLNRGGKEMSASELYKLLMEEAETLRKEKKRNTFSGIHKYLYLLKGKSRYSCLIDTNDSKIISFPPITNSEVTKLDELTHDLFIEITGESIPTCRKVMDTLLHGMVKQIDLGIKKVDCESKDGDDNLAAIIKPHHLEVEPVKVLDCEGKLYNVYPSRPDLISFDDVNVVRSN